jgi:hypothetical protein
MAELQQIGRLAFRVEGDTWRAYYALPGQTTFGELRIRPDRAWRSSCVAH